MHRSAVCVLLGAFAPAGPLPDGTAGQLAGPAALACAALLVLAVRPRAATRFGTAASPVRVRGLALRSRAHRLAFLPARDPCAAGRPRPG